ncbi:ESCRT-2 complex [Ascodesmis nigricans]|uniref:Vacuolar-sorting protein SNF8 n=1 Tax=Ascodesmis nigricans TaxID=341454 RepID=A0A4S2N565_9PEZI|nr:ESCRT-2 complex [Ascodesmis nigricans]
MQKGVGLGALTRNTKASQIYASHGERIQKAHLEELATQLNVFQAVLQEFARRHAKDIRSNPTFRAEFAQMCSAIGVDPLTSSSSKKGSFWAEMLGTSMNDFYFELAVRVVELCRATREGNGGLIAVAEVRDRIMKKDERTGGSSNISEDDILRAVESLKPLGSGFSVIAIGRRQMIRSVPKELNTDQSTVLEVIQVLGFVTPSMLRANLTWDRARVQTALEDLLSDSLVWVDDQADENEYWSPTFISQGLQP